METACGCFQFNVSSRKVLRSSLFAFAIHPYLFLVGYVQGLNAYSSNKRLARNTHLDRLDELIDRVEEERGIFCTARLYGNLDAGVSDRKRELYQKRDIGRQLDGEVEHVLVGLLEKPPRDEEGVGRVQLL